MASYKGGGYDIFNDPTSYGAGAYGGVGAYDTFTSAAAPVLPADVAAAAVPVPADAGAGPWGAYIGGGSPGAGKFPPAPGLGGGSGGPTDDFKFGFNPTSMNMVMSGLGTIGGLIQAFQDMKIRKQTLALQKGAFNKNYLNQIMAYNMKLKDRTRNRVESAGWSPAQGQAWIAENKLNYEPL